MHLLWQTAVALLLIGLFTAGCPAPEKPASGQAETQLQKGGMSMTPMTATLHLQSPAFNQQGRIPTKYACDGEDINPPLTISGIPKGTQSLALIVHDPDAPGGNWDHWILWNINPNTTDILENQVPEGAVQGMNDFNKMAYGGPCPPSGIHRYIFTLYALDQHLQISAGARRHVLQQAMQGHILAQTELIGIYQRQR